MGVMNEDWHNEHHLLPNAPLDERVRWHLQHQQKCACTPVPADVQAAIDEHSSQASSA